MSTVPFLSREAIELKAEEVIEFFSPTTLTKPQLTPIASICEAIKEQFNIAFDFNIDLGNTENDRKTLGKFIFSPRTILIDNSILNTVRFNFVLAHELGHLILHRNISYIRAKYDSIADSDYDFATGKKILNSDRDWIEWQANQFASSFLMPRSTIQYSVIKLQTDMGINRNLGNIFITKEPSSIRDFNSIISELSMIYSVNKTNLEHRLSDLGILIDHRLKDVKHISELLKEE